MGLINVFNSLSNILFPVPSIILSNIEITSRECRELNWGLPPLQFLFVFSHKAVCKTTRLLRLPNERNVLFFKNFKQNEKFNQSRKVYLSHLSPQWLFQLVRIFIGLLKNYNLNWVNLLWVSSFKTEKRIRPIIPFQFEISWKISVTITTLGDKGSTEEAFLPRTLQLWVRILAPLRWS